MQKVHQYLVDRFLKKLEDGRAPWLSLESGLPLPIRGGALIEKKPALYHGINVLTLNSSKSYNEYDKNIWFTLNQVSKLGGKPKDDLKGKSEMVIYYSEIEKKERDEKYLLLKYSNTFNMSLFEFPDNVHHKLMSARENVKTPEFAEFYKNIMEKEEIVISEGKVLESGAYNARYVETHITAGHDLFFALSGIAAAILNGQDKDRDDAELMLASEVAACYLLPFFTDKADVVIDDAGEYGRKWYREIKNRPELIHSISDGARVAGRMIESGDIQIAVA